MRALFLLLALIAAGCARPAPPEPEPLAFTDALITEDARWQGRILIDGSVRVTKGTTLTILPGADIAFVRRDADQDGLGDGTLQIDGILHARGTPEEPIVFRSAAADPQPGDWLEIHVDFSPEIHLRYCTIRDSAYALHAHFTRGVVEDCTIRNNIDGCRLGRARFVWRNNLIEGNIGKGINFRDATIEVKRNILRDNGVGVFLFEKDRDSPIHHNNFYANDYNFRLGDFFTGEVFLSDNWWGSADPQVAAQTVYDSRFDPAIGTVHLAPAAAWVSETGPRARVNLQAAWHFATTGFIDASVRVFDGKLAVASWDGNLTVLDRSGRAHWSRELGDVVDTRPAWDGRSLFVHTWAREIAALDPTDGEIRWRWSYPPSPADDHRQGALQVAGGLLLVPAWNGTLYALDPGRGELLWQYDGHLPLRAAPLVVQQRIYLAAGDGTLSALSLDGELLWKRDCGRPLLASPAFLPGGPVVLGKDGTLVAFDPAGEKRWSLPLGETCFYGSPVVVGEALFVATAGGGLWKIDGREGRVIWRQPLSGPGYATPLWHDGDLYVGDNAGTLQVFGADSGALRGSWRAAGPIQAAPVFSAGRLLIGSRDGRLYALEIEKRIPDAHDQQ